MDYLTDKAKNRIGMLGYKKTNYLEYRSKLK